MAAPFITTNDLVDYLGRGDIADPGVVIAADAACEIVRTLTEQPINQVVGGTIVMDGTGTDALLLPYLPVAAAGTVSVDGTAITDFVLRSDGCLLRTSGDFTVPSWPEGRQNVEVVCDYGYDDDTLPRDLMMVALSIAARLIVQGPVMQEQIGQANVKYATASTDLTSGEKAILRKYRKAR